MNVTASALCAGLFGAIVLVGAPAEAQPSASTRTIDYTEQITSGDQVVKFTDDELMGPLLDDAPAQIRARPGVIRCPLIRPRVNFVSELLKSVENF